ncbi:MAG: assimilatory sulfite reductase (NADPH) flavoprotein subunit [Paludibacter sp.]|nr:assimilatory sulfite reductase (NADPH) flavoprotein subunit [Paludibacter sp.]
MSTSLSDILTSDQRELFTKLTGSMNRDQLIWASGYLAGKLAQHAGAVEPVQTETITIAENVPSLTVLYGSRTGNGEGLAKKAREIASAQGLAVTVKSMENYKLHDLPTEKNLIVIVSTHGEGEPPLAAKGLHEHIFSKRAPGLEGVNYAVLALGDSSYFQFCQTGKDFDSQLEKLGATKKVPMIACDVDFEEPAEQWLKDTIASFATDSVVKSSNATRAFRMDQSGQKTVKTEASSFTKKNPFLAPVLEKISLHGKGSERQTLHLELNTEEAKDLLFEPGDAAGIIPLNPVALVNEVLQVTGQQASAPVDVKGNKTTLYEALYRDFELSKITTDVIGRYLNLKPNAELQKLVEKPEKYKEYLKGRDIVDLFQEYPAKLSAQELILLLRPLQARYYSIASSPKAYPGELHLTVGIVKFEDNGRLKHGTCSNYLSDVNIENETVQLFIESNPAFRLPENEETPIIMVGAGTGIAPFRAFVQHRELSEKRGKSWLFFGNRNFESEFLYQAEWLEYLKSGALTNMSVAFSRDSPQKEYVQQRLFENAPEIYKWVEEGAHIYICGDMKKMAGDVQAAFIKIIEKQGVMKKEQALEYFDNLQKEKRYQLDVY